METVYDDNVLEYWKLPNRNYIVKKKNDEWLDSDNGIKITLQSHLEAFNLRRDKIMMNNFFREINSCHNNSIYYGDTDSK